MRGVGLSRREGYGKLYRSKSRKLSDDGVKKI